MSFFSESGTRPVLNFVGHSTGRLICVLGFPFLASKHRLGVSARSSWADPEGGTGFPLELPDY